MVGNLSILRNQKMKAKKTMIAKESSRIPRGNDMYSPQR